jgi:putative NADH-flavin reductase
MLRATSRDDNRRATDARDEKRELLPAVQRALSEEQIQVVAEKIEAGVAEAEQGRDDESEARRLKARQERERAERQSERQAEAERLEKIRGDALKTQDVEASLIGVDVVMQTLGVGLGDLFRPVDLFSDATRVLIAAMRTQAVKRLICVTGFGAGDSRESISCLQRLPFQIVFGRAYEDKSLQERLIKESGLDWTIARPGVLTGGPRTGRYKILSEASQWRNGIISRSDVAEFLVRQMEDQTYIRQAPVLVN